MSPGGWGSLDDEDDDPVVARAAANGLRQARAVSRLISVFGSRLRITPRLVRGLHRIAMAGLSRYPGAFRPDGEFEPLGMHVPPAWDDVPGLVEEMCNVVAEAWDQAEPVVLSAYVLWRLNWIHPFDDGNGRTARALAYIVVCCRFGFELPSRHPMPERLRQHHRRAAYQNALARADVAWKQGVVDVTELAALLSQVLAEQAADTPLWPGSAGDE